MHILSSFTVSFIQNTGRMEEGITSGPLHKPAASVDQSLN